MKTDNPSYPTAEKAGPHIRDRAMSLPHEKSGGRNRKQEIFYPSTLLVLCIILFFFFLGERPLWDIDEGMHSATSKAMVQSGDWITPRFNGENFYDKPALFNWLVAASFMFFGFTEFAARLPSAVLGTGCVLLTYLMGRRMFGPTAGFLGGVILATSIEHIVHSRVVVHDIALAFFITLALFLFYMGFVQERHRRAYVLLSYVSAGLAVLSKGPVGLLLPGLIVMLFLIFRKKLSFIKEMHLRWGVLLFLAVAVPWYVLISLRNGDFAGYFLFHQNFSYFFSGESRHAEPFHYYFPLLLGGFFPWSFFLPLALIKVFQRGIREVDEGVLFLVLWFGTIFIFFSTASSKLSPYILPLFPACSLLSAALWNDLFQSSTRYKLHKEFLYPAVALTVTLLSGLVYFLVSPVTDLKVKYGIDLVHINYLLLLLSVWSIHALFFLLRQRHRAAFSALAGMVVSGMLFFIVVIAPSINPYRSTKGLAGQLDGLLNYGEKIVFYDKLMDSSQFYTDRQGLVLRGREEFMPYIASDKRIFFVIEKKSLKQFEDIHHVIDYIWGQEGNKLLISNRKSP